MTRLPYHVEQLVREGDILRAAAELRGVWHSKTLAEIAQAVFARRDELAA